MNRHLGLSLLFLSVLPASAVVSLLRDTVDTRTATSATGPMVTFNPAIPFVPNPGSDSLRVDSVTVRAVRVGQQAQLHFRLGRIKPGASASSSDRSFEAWYSQGTGFSFFQSTRFAIGPMDTARLLAAGFDWCIFCPVVKRAAVLALGDTLKAWVIFHGGGQKDSAFFLSVERVPTSLAPWFAAPSVSSGFRFYDPLGRAVERRRISLPALPASSR
jgi:hypothetical protein